MKLITAYVSTVRIHWIVEELQRIGIQEAKATEYFTPLSRISRLELLCPDDHLKEVTSMLHRVGTTGEVVDHFIHVADYVATQPDPGAAGRFISALDIRPGDRKPDKEF